MKLTSTNRAFQGLSIKRSRKWVLSLALLLISFVIHGQVCQFTASEITGPTNACAYSGVNGQTAVYSVLTTDASTFTWQLPVNATLLSGQGANTILVRFKNAFTGGAISVQIGNACGGAGASRTIQIGKEKPEAPISMDGPPVICDLESPVPVTYTIPAVPGVTQYNWSVPNYTTLVSGQGTTSITVLFSADFSDGNIMVRSVAACATSSFLKYFVSAVGPGRPGPITGQTHGICADNNIIEYNIAPVRNASSYSWSTTVPGAVIDNQGPKAIITFPPFTSGSVYVSALGECPVSGVRSLAVTSKVLHPDSVKGPTSVCAGSVQTFSVDSVQGATLFDWTVPEGSIINSGNGSRSINVTIGPSGGAVTVRAGTECGFGAPVSKEILVDECLPECEMSIFPNPTPGPFNVTFCTKLDGAYSIYVTDVMTGRILFQSEGPYLAGENTISADITHLDDGIYIFYLITNEFVKNERIEVSHAIN